VRRQTHFKNKLQNDLDRIRKKTVYASALRKDRQPSLKQLRFNLPSISPVGREPTLVTQSSGPRATNENLLYDSDPEPAHPYQENGLKQLKLKVVVPGRLVQEADRQNSESWVEIGFEELLPPLVD